MYPVCLDVCVCVCACKHACTCVWEREVELRPLEQKQTVHKEALPLSHFNVNESDSFRGLKNSLEACWLQSLGSYMHMHARIHTQAESHKRTGTNVHAHTQYLRREAQIKSSESLSECQLPLGQRLLCVCAGRRTAFYISFSTHTRFFLTHILPEPPRLANMLFQTRHTKDNGTRLKRQTSPTFPTSHAAGKREETKQALNDLRWAKVEQKRGKFSRIPYIINLPSEQERKLLQPWCVLCFPFQSPKWSIYL